MPTPDCELPNPDHKLIAELRADNARLQSVVGDLKYVARRAAQERDDARDRLSRSAPRTLVENVACARALFAEARGYAPR